MIRVTALLALGIQLAGCSPLFILRAGYEEAKILSRRQSIARLIQDPEVPAERRGKLELVVDARDFADQALQLEVGDSYTTFSQLDSDTLALVLSAARKDAFVPYTWWFPIVGRVPYRAVFGVDSAREAVEDLEEKGYDAYVRPTTAFSTLGWFNDPLVSPLLRYDSVSLASTVIHELLHNTIYLPGQAMFNESLAQFVGSRGAIEFFCDQRGEDELCDRARAAWQDQLLFGAFISDLVADLQELYARTDLDSSEKIARREVIFDRARRDFDTEVRPKLRFLGFGSFGDPLNNASLIARRIYYRRLDLFDAVYQASGGDLRQSIARIIAVANEEPDDPYGAVERLLGGPSEPSPPSSVATLRR